MPYRVRAFTCEVCGTEFSSRGPSRKFCSTPCRNRAQTIISTVAVLIAWVLMVWELGALLYLVRGW